MANNFQCNPPTPEEESEQGSFKIAIIVIILIIIAGTTWWLWQKGLLPGVPISEPTSTYNTASTTAADLPDLGGGGVDLGGVAPASAKATEDIPELNPIEKINPFKGVFTNPFGE